MIQPAIKTQHLGDDLKPVRIESVSVNVLRNRDIALGRQRRQQIKSLKNKSDLVPAKFGAFRIAHRHQVVAVYQYVSARSLGQTAQHVKQG